MEVESDASSAPPSEYGDEEPSMRYSSQIEVDFGDGHTLMPEEDASRVVIDLSENVTERIQNNVGAVSRDDKERLIGSTMRFLLAKNNRREKCTTKHIKDAVFQGPEKSVRGIFNYVIYEAQRRFRDLLGVELVPGQQPATPDGFMAADSKKGSRPLDLASLMNAGS